MQVTITSGGILALCAALGLISGFTIWAIKAVVATELRALNGRYVYSAGSKLTGHEIEGRLHAIEGKLKLAR